MDDDDLWQDIVEKSKPLPLGKKRLVHIRPEISPRSFIRNKEIGVIDGTSMSFPDKRYSRLNILQKDSRNDVDRNTSKKLAQGKVPMEAMLDLHGQTAQKAKAHLTSFVHMCYSSGKRCVLVVTGKGKGQEGVLYQSVPEWVNLPEIRKYIVMYTQAMPKDGGKGALYLLIRRRRSEGSE